MHKIVIVMHYICTTSISAGYLFMFCFYTTIVLFHICLMNIKITMKTIDFYFAESMSNRFVRFTFELDKSKKKCLRWLSTEADGFSQVYY